jgi:hypothetical protein
MLSAWLISYCITNNKPYLRKNGKDGGSFCTALSACEYCGGVEASRAAGKVRLVERATLKCLLQLVDATVSQNKTRDDLYNLLMLLFE